MNRRGFLKGLAAVVGGVALEEAIPFGRVWSFPKEISLARNRLLTTEEVFREFNRAYRSNLDKATLAFRADAFSLAGDAFLRDEQFRLDYAITHGTGWFRTESIDIDEEINAISSLPSAS